MTERAAPFITVVLCTHNRELYLAMAIDSILAQHAKGVPYELLVVDNCSTDGTSVLCERYAGRLEFRYIQESQLGLCHARNAGWRNARGVIVAYFDDDAIADPGWVKAIAEAFIQYPNAGVAGGQVRPIWERTRPRWLSDGIAYSLTIVDWSSQPKLIPDPRVEWLVGANMAIPARILDEVGGFETRLDRSGTSMLSGGDVFLQHRIVDLGYECVYFPEMSIRHLVPVNRLTKSWFTHRYYWQGISDAVMALIRCGPMTWKERVGAAGREALGLLSQPKQMAEVALSTDDPVQFERKCMALIRIGFIAGMLGKAKA